MLAAEFARRAVGESTETLIDPRSHEEVVVGELVSEDEAPIVEQDDVADEGAEIIDVELSGYGADSRRRWFFQAG
jgi:hypothetical protein